MDGPIHSADLTSRDCIDRSEEYEVAFWTVHFGVSREELLEVMANVGPRVSDVTAHFATRS